MPTQKNLIVRVGEIIDNNATTGTRDIILAVGMHLAGPQNGAAETCGQKWRTTIASTLKQERISLSGKVRFLCVPIACSSSIVGSATAAMIEI